MDYKIFKENFGTKLANRLFRHGIKTVDELKKYINIHPFSKTIYPCCYYWYGIGPNSYQKILDFLEKDSQNLH